MANSIIFEERVEIPLTVRSLADFRSWTHSDEFPEFGRIDYIAGKIEVDATSEDLFCHGTPKIEIVGTLGQRVKQQDLGHLFTDSTRVCCPDAELSVEPDIVFVSHESLEANRVRLVPAASRADTSSWRGLRT